MSWKIYKPCLKTFWKDDAGQDLLEYTLIAALIGLGVVVAMKSLTANMGTMFNAVGSAMTSGI